MKRNFTFIFFTLLFTGFLAKAQTPDGDGIVYVTPDGGGDGSSWSSPTSNLQGAINATGTQKVFVGIGTYYIPSPSSFVMKNNVGVYGGFDPEHGIKTLTDARIFPTFDGKGSILSGRNERPVIWTDGGNAADNITFVLDGFTITEGKDVYPTFNTNAIHLRYTTPALTNLIIRNNHDGVTTVFMEYSAAAATKVKNVAIVDNSYIVRSPNSAAVWVRGDDNIINFENMTIANNKIDDTPKEYYSGTYASFFVQNNKIAIKNSIALGRVDVEEGGSYTVDHAMIPPQFDYENGIYGAADGDIALPRTLFVEQLFTNPSAGDYTLKAGSLAIDAGNNNGFTASSKDLQGNARVYNYAGGGVIDLGAFESTYRKPTPDASGIVYVRENVTGNGSGDSWENALNDIQTAIHALQNVQKIYVAIGTYSVGSASFIMKNDVEIYGGFNPVGNTTDWDTRTLPNKSMDNGSVLDGQNIRPVIFNDNNGLNSTALLDGFTITNGKYSTGGGMYNNNVSPTLSNLWIKDNTATADGGGIYNVNSSSPVITNVTLSNNTANYAGGIFNRNNSSPVMTNVVINANTATNDGGGMYNDASSSPVMNKVSIAANQATNGAGMYNRNQSSPTITNGLIADNIATGNGGAIRNESTSSPSLTNVTIANSSGTNTLYATNGSTSLANTIVYGTVSGAYTAQNSLIEGNAGGTNGNLDGTTTTLEQLFTAPSAKDYSLKSGSPAIDAGNKALFAGLDADAKDLAGNARLDGINIDLGAYEHIGTLPVSLINFTAKADGDHALLQWKTAQEVNSFKFIVYRKSGEGDFVEIGTKQGAGTVTTSQDYVFYDNSPLLGTNYYKLVQIDNDGKATELGIRQLNFGLPTSDIRLYPNPTTDMVTVTFAPGIYRQLQVVDLRGRILQQINLNGTESDKQISLGVHPAGTYMIKLQGNGKRENRKIVKK